MEREPQEIGRWGIVMIDHEEVFRSGIRMMKAVCKYQWDHVPKDKNGDFEYSACCKCAFNHFCEKYGLRNSEYAGPVDWKIPKT